MAGVVHALHRGRIINTHLHWESGRAHRSPFEKILTDPARALTAWMRPFAAERADA
jgi:hypothetical protein